MQFSKGCQVHLLCFLDVFKQSNFRNILLNFNNFAGTASSSFYSPAFFAHSSAGSSYRECVWGIDEIPLCHTVEYILYCRKLQFLWKGQGCSRSGAGMGLAFLCPRFLSNAEGLWPKNKCKPKKCCAGISAWTWKNTKAFFFSLISQCLSSVCYQGRRKAISSVHSDFILIQLLYWL